MMVFNYLNVMCKIVKQSKRVTTSRRRDALELYRQRI